MIYDWDPDKAQQNSRKHKIRFADAVSVFQDDYALTIEDNIHGEQRFITLGRDAFGRILFVVYTYRHDVIRLISARKATAAEQQQYRE